MLMALGSFLVILSALATARCEIHLEKPINPESYNDMQNYFLTITEQMACGDRQTGIEPIDPLQYKDGMTYENYEYGLSVKDTQLKLSGIQSMKFKNVKYDYEKHIGSYSVQMSISVTGNTTITSTVNEDIPTFVSPFEIHTIFSFTFSGTMEEVTLLDGRKVPNFYNEKYKLEDILSFKMTYDNAKTCEASYKTFAPLLNIRKVRDDLVKKYFEIYITVWLRDIRRFLLASDINDIMQCGKI